ncbi:MAG: hypothetical protein PHR83_15925 [Paludibacter sp.]|nr:hypothetical protein [Paludibacter sp.]
MRYKKCEICGKRAEQNKMVIVENTLYCIECFEKEFEEKELLNGKKVIRELDPTVCSNCNHDNGGEELPKLSIYPICLECKKVIDKQVFPDWVKAFIAGTIAIIIIGFIWNLRFFKAYEHIHTANTNYVNGNYENASRLMSLAVIEVPEVEDIKAMAGFFKGIDLLVKDSCTEALFLFEKYKQAIPADVNLKSFIIQARAGSFFDKKNYKGFLDASNQYLALDSTQAQSWAGVASAYSCLYAETKNEEYKTQTYTCLAKAMSLDSTSKQMKEYMNLIEYRIYSKQIIRREQFKKQFPTGWSKI